MKRSWLCALVVGLLLPCGPLFAGERREADDDIVDRRVRNILRTIPESNLKIPSALPSDRHVYVLITAGAAYFDVKVLARPSVSPQRVAEALEAACRNTVFAAEPVEWSQSDQFSAAHLFFSNGRLWSRSSATEAPVGNVVAGIRAEGFTPYALLRIPRHATTPAVELPTFKTRSYVWYDASQVPGSFAASVRAEISQGKVILALAFVFFVPGIGLSGLLSAILFARSQRIPIDVRRKVYLKLVYYPTFGSIFLHAPFAFTYLRSYQQLAIADLWFGSPTSSSVLAPLLMLPPLLIFLVLPISVKVERKLFGASETAPAPPEVSPAEKAVRKRVMFWSLVPQFAGLALLLSKWFLLPPRHPLASVMFPIAIVLLIGGPAVVQWILRKQVEQFERYTTDEELTQRATALAREMGVTLQEVKIYEGATGQQSANALMLPRGRMVITRKLVAVLKPAELDSIIAHELAHLKGKHILRQVSIGLLAMSLLMLPFFLLVGEVRVQAEWMRTAVFWVPMLGFLLMFVGSMWFSRRREHDADRIALEVTRNLEAAESALVKIVQYSPLPYIHDVTDYSTHPRLSKRLTALRQAAQALGLPAK